MTPTPFRLQIPAESLHDLRRRLSQARYPDTAPGEPWACGTDVDYMQTLLAYWRDQFDWRAQEARLNALPQFKVEIGDADVHFLHVPGKRATGGPEPTPLLLLHGWPGSVFEFLDIIDRLTDPARFGGNPHDAFTVVAPSLPGFGLSYRPGHRYGLEAMTDRVARLMIEVLGYSRFAAQGGDWGSFVASRLAITHPQHLLGIHLNFMPLRRDGDFDQTDPDQARYREELALFLKEEAGYQWIQGTRPQTLAFGLNDSPLGLAAWLIEKFQRWTDNDGDPEQALSRDVMLANISFYWFTGCIASSFWPYYARMRGPWPIAQDGGIQVPMGYTQFPREILRPPRSLAARSYADIRRWTVCERGGHFAALEQPAVLAHEIREFFRPLRSTIAS
jgi:pimeloyl-ACP methyl ester carboxylesterase